ncbi:MAG: aminomethyl-transferring glycine dehydrogenase, partial [Terracoccus sp.]
MSINQAVRTAPFSDFVGRHVGPRGADVDKMLQVVGQPSLEAMCDRAIPGAIRSEAPLALEAAASESAVIDELRAFAARNTVLTSLIGLGYYGTVTPPVVKRNVLENPAWYTAYTPYQPEISQGRLEALLNFQTVVTDLTGLDVAGSSLLDESTAAAEAMSLMRRTSKAASDAVVLVDAQVFPQTIAVMQTRAGAIELPLVVADLTSVTSADGLAAAAGGRAIVGVVVQYPAASGEIADFTALTAAAHEAGALVTACADLLALTLITAPQQWGADIAVGSAQRFGVPMGFGGPHAGYIAVRKGLERSMPGRLVGVSVDAEGNQAYRLALQTREQHIRREKATSNICTAQVLLAVMASMYAVWHGPEGLTDIARRVQALTGALRRGLVSGGFEIEGDTFFDTLTVRAPDRATELVAQFVECGFNLRLVDADRVSISLDETTTAQTVVSILEVVGVAMDPDDLPSGAAEEVSGIPSSLVRESDFLTHPVFHAHHSETAMLRYLRRLSDRDFALDRGMIPLGSCTMKLNATTEMEPVTWPEFANLHPFAPADQTTGIRALIDELAAWLCEITGYDAVSLQPNAGSQGEFTGLLAIHAYHQSRGEGHRRICLIPASAHGTNAASAVMAGLKVVVVKTAPGGTVDMDDLRAKIETHGDNLAAIMVTYPSTHGVYEDTITELCALVHDAGGQVYVDGANLNALVGLAQPGKFGADVSHLNLHKTFCIPHGGGGPGVGPVGVRAHLAPHLPNHPLAPEAGPATGVGPVSGAPFGSASILPISWAYVRL